MQRRAVLLVLCLAGASAFSLSTSSLLTNVRGAPRLRSLQRRNVVCELTRIEVKSVERMTKQYDKLCKTCPTRLQPRADIITEMLVNLDEHEREGVLEGVAKRLSGVVMAETAGMPMKGEDTMPKVTQEKAMDDKEEMNMKMGDAEKKKMKLEGKIQKNEMKLTEAKKKVETIAIMDSESGDLRREDTKLLMKLREMSKAELEIYRLKAMEKMFKYERKAAECKLKLKMLNEREMAPVC